MKNILSLSLTIAFAFILVKAGTPGQPETFFGVNGAHVQTIEQAYHFETMKEIYTKQLELNDDWQIRAE